MPANFSTGKGKQTNVMVSICYFIHIVGLCDPREGPGPVRLLLGFFSYRSVLGSDSNL
jgi:hypothetical protein